MGFIKLQKIILTAFVYLLHSVSYALVETMTIGANHLQTITVETPSNDNYLTSDSITRITTWVVKSNNAVTINFSGTSPEDDVVTSIPRFYKQKVNAKNQFIADQYDYLDTKFGAMLENIDSTEKGSISLTPSAIKYSTWGGGLSPNIASELLIDKTNDLSPNGYWGAIMPSDTNDFILTLYSKGTGDVTSQSGIYTLYLSLNVTAREILNP